MLNMDEFKQLLNLAIRKSKFDQHHDWSNGAQTYLTEMKLEIDEVIEEIPKLRDCYLEEELGDVLWDYLNVLVALKQERGIDLQSVLARACRKYDERVSGIESGERWHDIKQRQKQILKAEQDSTK